MSRLPALIAAIASVSFVAITPPHAVAQEAADLEMSQFKFTGTVITDNVYVRSGASENDYPTMQLSKGQVVTVVGEKFEWLKILPPQGSFCLVGKSWVDRRGDGTIGRVREDSDAVNVRIGSTLNNMIKKVALKLKAGDDVRIIGDSEGYFKIEPPAGTFMYVNKKFVEPGQRVDVLSNNGATQVKPLEGAADTTPAPAPSGVPSAVPSAVPSGVPAAPVTPTAPMADNVTPQPTEPAAAPRTNDPLAIATDTTSAAATDTGTTTQPAAKPLSPTATFDALESRLVEAAKMPIEQQPIDELLAGYQALLAEKKAPESMLRIADHRTKDLQVRKGLLTDYQQVRKMQADLAPKQMALRAESDEIAQRIEQNRVQAFAAVGTLRPSALMMNGRTLYRLTDPSTGRTVVYVQTDDAAMLQHDGQLVGVRGTVTEDAARQIKFVRPTEVRPVDQAAVLKGDVTSPLTPPSLLPATAASGR